MTRDVLFLPISGPQGASSRYRVLQFLPTLDAAGISWAVHLPPDAPRSGLDRLFASLRERLTITAMANEFRLIFIQKRLLPTLLIDKLAGKRPLLFDLDDAIFTTPKGDRSPFVQRRVERRLKAVLSTAQTVIVGNRYLRDYAAQFAKRVIQLPTVLDVNRYPAKIHNEANPIVIGWIGHSVNHPYLFELKGVLQRLAATFNIRLLIVSDRDLEIPGVAAENRRWSEATEVADILRMDIGVMPMPDDPWSRGKCGFKAIQYMAAGIPVVCSAVGANLDIVRDGIDGYCASTPNQWHEYLAELCTSSEKRQYMGNSARLRVEEAYSLDSAAPVWRNIVLDALANGRRLGR